jgi:spore germination protein KC
MLVVAFCGCWDYIDVESEFVVMGVTIDKDKETNEFKINAEIAKSTGGQNAKLVTRVETSSGSTVFDAIRNIIKKIGAKLYWGHSMVYIISESVAREGISDVMSLLSNQTQMRSDMFIMICEDASVDKVFTFQDPIHETVSQHIHDLFESYEASGKFRRAPLFRVLQELASEDICLMLPYIKMTDEHNEINARQENGQSSGNQGGGESGTNNVDPGRILVTEGSMIFKGDKGIDLFDETQTRSALILKGEETKSYSIAIPEQGNIPNCSIEDILSDLKITPSLDDESKLRIKIDIALDVDVVEIQTTEDLITDEKKGEIEAAFQTMLLGQFSDAILKAQKDGADIFGFAGATHRALSGFYKSVSSDWNNVFSHAVVDISVAVDITNSSLTIKPVKVGM